MERYIAIDGVCAWPNLTQMPNGEIIATIFNQPCHGKWSGDVECWGSTDGRFWQKRGTPAPHEAGTNRMNVGAGLAADGALIVLASGWSHRVPRPDPMPVYPHDATTPEEAARYDFTQASVLDPWVCRSTDGGRTWTRDGRVERPEMMANLIPFGDIALDSERRPCASFYGWDNKSDRRRGDRFSWFFRSPDDGRTWKPVCLIGNGNHNETTLLHLGGGRWLAAARTAAEKAIEMFASADDGATWTSNGLVTFPGQHPAQLLRLADGRILFCFGLRNIGLRGVGARVSDDEGRTWGAPRVLVTYDLDADGGYPASAQIADGTIVTAYYSSSAPAHQRYHMGVVRWKIEARTA